MSSPTRVTDTLWIYTQAGAFRFLCTDRWEGLYARVVKSGWEMPSAGDTGWLQSELNPYPNGAFFSETDAKSFAEALTRLLAAESSTLGFEEVTLLTRLVGLFNQGALLIRQQSPRKTTGTSLLEVVYAYSCQVCGFLYSGSWLFDTREQNSQSIRSSVQAMLKLTYCPLCGSKDITAASFFLEQVDPDGGADFTTASPGPE